MGTILDPNPKINVQIEQFIDLVSSVIRFGSVLLGLEIAPHNVFAVV